MAKYTATFACGHESEVQLLGKHTERDRKLAYLSKQTCDACLSAEKVARDAAAVQANAKPAPSGLPTLTGSEKQIAWAMQIRRDALVGLAQAMTTKAGDLGPMAAALAAVPEDLVGWGAVADFHEEKGAAPAATAIRKLVGTVESKWWIENARDGGALALKAAAK